MSSIFQSKFSKWTSFLTAALFVATLAPSDADARRKKRRRKKAPVAAVAKVNVNALQELMGAFKFGMSKDRVLKVLDKQLEERYKAKIKQESDVYGQDALRREKKKKVKAIRASYSEFKGKKTGWDVSIIDDQFGHKTDESMLVYWEQNHEGADQRRFFFFHGGSLYKMFIVLDSKMLPVGRRNFETFSSLMSARYGGGKVVPKSKRTSALVDWSTNDLHVQAIDKVAFYGSFCLMIASQGTEASVMADRDSVRVVKKSNSIIDSMIEGDDALPPSLDSNSNAIDSAFK